MEDKGEIEFFGFVPVNFVNELETDILNKITSFVQTFNLKGRILLESSKKNLFIFKNFVLRNILVFPKNFWYDRKMTDLVVEDTVPLIKHSDVLQNLSSIRDEVENLRQEVCLLRNKKSNLSKILEYEGDIKETILNMKCVRDKYSTLLEYVHSLPFHDVQEEEFSHLLEYREIRSETLRKEYDNMADRIDI